MDKRDIALQSSHPTVMAPRFAPLEPATKPGERLLIASNGVFLEVTRKWARFVRKVGDITVPVPYGTCEETTEWLANELPLTLLAEFATLARNTPDVEVGASIVWNENTGLYSLTPVEPIEATGGSLHYRRSALNDGEHLVVDCHSHAHFAAFFSSQDNEDDRMCVKIAHVLGHCNRAAQTTKTRLCIKGIFEDITLT